MNFDKHFLGDIFSVLPVLNKTERCIKHPAFIGFHQIAEINMIYVIQGKEL
jgi:hypothetical protein